MTQKENGRRKNKNIYLKNERILAAMLDSQKKGQPTEEYGKCCMLIVDNMLHGRSFRGYSQHMKEDMAGNAYLRCMKAIHTFNAQKTENAFGYITRTVWTAFLQILKDHYKHLNIKKSLFEKILAQTDDEFAKNQLLEWQRNEWKDVEEND